MPSNPHVSPQHLTMVRTFEREKSTARPGQPAGRPTLAAGFLSSPAASRRVTCTCTLQHRSYSPCRNGYFINGWLKSPSLAANLLVGAAARAVCLVKVSCQPSSQLQRSDVAYRKGAAPWPTLVFAVANAVQFPRCEASVAETQMPLRKSAISGILLAGTECKSGVQSTPQQLFPAVLGFHRSGSSLFIASAGSNDFREPHSGDMKEAVERAVDSEVLHVDAAVGLQSKRRLLQVFLFCGSDTLALI